MNAFNRQGGTIIAAAMFVLIIVGAMSVTLSYIFSGAMVGVQHNLLERQAFQAAESAAQMVLKQILGASKCDQGTIGTINSVRVALATGTTMQTTYTPLLGSSVNSVYTYTYRVEGVAGTATRSFQETVTFDETALPCVIKSYLRVEM